jgi:hypothetical protein
MAVTNPVLVTAARAVFAMAYVTLLDPVASAVLPSWKDAVIRIGTVCPCDAKYRLWGCAKIDDTLTAGSMSIDTGFETTVCPEPSRAQAVSM